MSRRSQFDPPLYAGDIRRNPRRPLSDADLAHFGVRGCWQAGTSQLQKVIIGWWVGEGRVFDEVLRQALHLLDAPEGKGRPWGEPAVLYEASHRHARALGHWMAGRNRAALWHDAADTYARAVAEVAGVSFDELVPAAILCRAMAGMQPLTNPSLPEPHGDFAAAIARVVVAAGDAAAFGRVLVAEHRTLLVGQPGLALTTLFALAFQAACAPDRAIEQAVLTAYVVDATLALPPALVERGWSDRREAIVASEGIRFEWLGPLLGLVGLARDPDAVPQGDPPEFASWTRSPGPSLEVDWHARSGEPARLEIRGAGSGRLASLIAETLGGKVAGDPETALAELLTVPPRAAPASAPAAQARWEILCATVRDEHALDEIGGRALVRAGLADSDWRVRMSALWAVGHFRLRGAAREAEAAALPKSGFPGLSQDDRRVLLAMRDLAAARSAGRPDTAKKGANAGFVNRIAGLLDRLPERPGDRAERLLAALLRRGAEGDQSRIPSAWKQWLAAGTR
jgi:hypothetical protein